MVLLNFFHSFEWSLFRISSIGSKVKTTFYGIKKKHHRKELFNSVHLNGHTFFGFHPQMQKLKPSCTAKLSVAQESAVYINICTL